jgi:hypothetical protein
MSKEFMPPSVDDINLIIERAVAKLPHEGEGQLLHNWTVGIADYRIILGGSVESTYTRADGDSPANLDTYTENTEDKQFSSPCFTIIGEDITLSVDLEKNGPSYTYQDLSDDKDEDELSMEAHYQEELGLNIANLQQVSIISELLSLLNTIKFPLSTPEEAVVLNKISELLRVFKNGEVTDRTDIDDARKSATPDVMSLCATEFMKRVNTSFHQEAKFSENDTDVRIGIDRTVALSEAGRGVLGAVVGLSIVIARTEQVHDELGDASRRKITTSSMIEADKDPGMNTHALQVLHDTGYIRQLMTENSNRISEFYEVYGEPSEGVYDNPDLQDQLTQLLDRSSALLQMVVTASRLNSIQREKVDALRRRGGFYRMSKADAEDLADKLK